MKKIKRSVFSLGLCLSVTCAVNAQDVSASKVPPAVRAAFAKANPGVKASWEIEEGNYEAGYMKNGLENSIFYTPTGKMVKYETGINPSALPAPVSNYIKKNFAGKKIAEAAKVTMASGVINYLVVVKGSGKATMFDSNGKYLTTVAD